MTTFSALGAGNMANAILSGAVAAGCLKPEEIGTYNVHEEKRRAMAAKGYTVYTSIPELCRDSRYILLSMKPQQAEEVLLAMKPAVSSRNVIISIAAGISQKYIQSILGSRNDYAGVEKLGYNRAINRKKYSSKEITTELNNKATLRYSIYYKLTHLITLRRSHKEFHPDNNFTIDAINSFVMRIQRSNADGDCLTGLFNVSENIQHINITDLHGRDLISEVDILGNEITLHPWQVMWIK